MSSQIKEENAGEGEAACNLLKEPIHFGDLIGSGAKFEMNTDFDEGFINEIHDELFDSDDENINVDHEKLASPWLKPFSELKLQMIKIDELIYKRIMVQGNIEAGLMPKNSRVSIKYNAYWEGKGAPFDSSYLRGSTFSFYTGQSSVLEGLEKSVLTMYMGEQSQFVISYELLFGKMGCPPRVEPSADGLFIIELVSFNAVGDLDATNNIPEEDRNKYSIVVEKVKEIQLKGKDFFKQGMYKNAARAFEKAVDSLNFCRLANEIEENAQKEFLIMLYTNLSVCYNKMKLYSRTLLMAKEIKRLTKNNTSCKALFQEGRAFLELGEYTKAKNILIRAQHKEPKSLEIIKELEKLEERKKKYEANEKLIWQKALGGNKKQAKKEDEEKSKENLTEFEENMFEVLQNFKNSSLNEKFKFPLGLSQDEFDTIDKLAKDLDLILEINPDETHSIRKK